ncbi:MAG TPA: LPS export ABC transporter permease LptF [Candidatus Acidoferrum sp.]|nr:LPS export ABC transporter permease LptF [Candidatus Acidoferrum sp.]
MRLLDKYISREVASHALLGLAVFTFVFFVPQLVRLMDLVVRHSGGFGTVTLLFLCTLPPALTFTIPMAVLVGVLIGLGRLSADSEIVALHALGVSLRRLLLPIGLVALACGLLNLAITFWLGPASVRTLRSLEDQIRSTQIPYAVVPRVFDERFPKLVLYVRDVAAAATDWRGVFLAESSADSTPTEVTVAASAMILPGPSKDQIELELGAGSTHEYDPRDPKRYNVTTFSESTFPVDISPSSSRPKSVVVSAAEKSTLELIHDNGPTWRESRVEFQRRLAFPAACLVFALLGVPIGVRPRRGGRAAGMILTLVLIGSYYFLFVTGAHLAEQGSLSPWLGIWMANFAAIIVGVALLIRIEEIRQPSRALAWIHSRLDKLRAIRRSPAPPLPIIPNGTKQNGGPGPNGYAPRPHPATSIRRAVGAGSSFGFPMLIDVYLLQRFFYYFFVLLAGFVLIFDAFTLFDLLADISRNHIPVGTVLDYFRYLIPFMVYQLCPLATLVATLVTLAVLAKNNEVVAFKASGISLYRLVIPLTLAGLLLAGGLFLLDNTFLPYANQQQDALRNEIKGRPAQTYLQPSRQWIFGEGDKIYNYELYDPDRQLFGGLSVFELDPSTFQIRRRVYATRASWEPSENTWILTGGWIRDFDGARITNYIPFKVDSLPELSEPPSYFRREVRQSEQMNARELGEYILGLRRAGFDTSRLSVQWQKKFSFPLIAAIIVFLGAPFAFLVGTRGAISGLALAVGIGIVYWATSALFEAMGSVGQLPPFVSAWAPDAIFAFLGIYFFLKMPT